MFVPDSIMRQYCRIMDEHRTVQPQPEQVHALSYQPDPWSFQGHSDVFLTFSMRVSIRETYKTNVSLCRYILMLQADLFITVNLLKNL